MNKQLSFYFSYNPEYMNRFCPPFYHYWTERFTRKFIFYLFISCAGNKYFPSKCCYLNSISYIYGITYDGIIHSFLLPYIPNHSLPCIDTYAYGEGLLPIRPPCIVKIPYSRLNLYCSPYSLFHIILTFYWGTEDCHYIITYKFVEHSFMLKYNIYSHVKIFVEQGYHIFRLHSLDKV